eukprot:Gb_04754 [translate_table: standard]
MARHMTFENTAGLRKGQALALQVGSDRSTAYRCSIKAVFQSCNILARKPLYGMLLPPKVEQTPIKTLVSPSRTAGERSVRSFASKEVNPDLPQKVMETILLDSVHVVFLRRFDLSFRLVAVVGEFRIENILLWRIYELWAWSRNCETSEWPGYRVITTVEEANKFIIAVFISENLWLPSTGVAFQAGLIGGM